MRFYDFLAYAIERAPAGIMWRTKRFSIYGRSFTPAPIYQNTPLAWLCVFIWKKE